MQIIVLANDFLQFNNVRMSKLPQRLHFPQGHTFIPRIILPLHPLDRHLLTSLLICGKNNLSICTIADTLENNVAVHRNGR